MSTEAIHFQHLLGRFQHLLGRQYSTNEEVQMEVSKDADSAVSRAPSKLVYRLLHMPHPTPEELRREYFLLECD